MDGTSNGLVQDDAQMCTCPSPPQMMQLCSGFSSAFMCSLHRPVPPCLPPFLSLSSILHAWLLRQSSQVV